MQENRQQFSRRQLFRKVLEVYRDQGVDIIGRNAKQLVFALARRLNVTGVSNCEQAWAYVETVCTHPAT